MLKVPDICIIELGGTVGDIESAIFTEALRQLRLRVEESKDHSFLVCVLSKTKFSWLISLAYIRVSIAYGNVTGLTVASFPYIPGCSRSENKTDAKRC